MMDSDNDEYLSIDEGENPARNFDDYEALLNLDEHVV
jgi:hypothetical protein